MFNGAFEAFCDGSASPNPGVMGIGFSVFKNRKEVFFGAAPRGHGSNNEAEYLALIWLLEQCIEKGITELCVYVDSQLVVKQVNGEWSVGNERLATLHTRVRELTNGFENFKLCWLSRNKNKRADALSKRGALLSEPKVHITLPETLANNKGRDNKTDTAEALDSAVEADTAMAIRVIAIQDELVIIEKGKREYFDCKRQTCSCEAFRRQRTCKHLKAFLSLSKRAEKGKAA